MDQSKKDILIIGYVWPETNASAAGVRCWWLTTTLLRAGYRVHFASQAKSNEFSEKLRSLGVDVFPIGENLQAFDAWIESFSPGVTIFDRFLTEEKYGHRVRERVPECARILDTCDLHFLRRAREKAFVSQAPLNLNTEDRLREIASIYRSDLSLIISDFEVKMLTQDFALPTGLIAHLPFAYEVPEANLDFSKKLDFASIGNFRHAPNLDSVKWLARELWPAIRSGCPEAKLFIYGAYPPKEVMALANKNLGIQVEGFVPDQYEVLRKHRVSLAPLRFGAGLKGKIADSWFCGTPVISTSVGAEGMRDEHAWGGAIADDAASFVQSAIRHYRDQKLWESSKFQGDRLLKALFSAPEIAVRFLDALDQTQRSLSQIRAHNHVGEILWHHAHRSTTYFSKWIELKSSLASPLQS